MSDDDIPALVNSSDEGSDVDVPALVSSSDDDGNPLFKKLIF